MARRKALRAGSGGGALRFLERTGVARGVFGTSKGWFYVGAGLWTLRKVRTIGGRKPEVLLREELKPGQRLILANDRATLSPVDALAASSIEVASDRRRRSRRTGR